MALDFDNKLPSSSSFLYNPENIYPCPWGKCTRYFKQKSSLLRHYRLHKAERVKRSYECAICDKKFSQLSNLRVHTTAHLIRKEKELLKAAKHQKMYPCDFAKCGKSFTSRQTLKKHTERHIASELNDEKLQQLTDYTNVDTKPEQSTNYVIYEIYEIGEPSAPSPINETKPGPSKINLNSNDLLSFNLHSDDLSLLAYNKASNVCLCSYCSDDLHHPSNKQEQHHICDFIDCEELFSSPAKLSKHLKQHSTVYPHICGWPSCTKRFTQLDFLRTPKLAVCDTWMQPNNSNVIQKQPVLFKCTWRGCTIVVPTWSGLIKHRAVHTRDEMFECSICSRRYQKRVTFIQHVRNNHIK